MKKLKFVAPFLFFIMSPLGLLCGDNDKLPEAFLRYKGLYGVIMYTNISGFPMTSLSSVFIDPEEEITFESSASCPSFALGGVVLPPNYPNIYIGAELEFSIASFTDRRVSDRKISFSNIFLDIGIFPSKKIPLVIYGSLGGGWLHQFDYNEGSDDYGEYLEKNDYPVMYGIGVKFSPLKHLILKGELKYIKKERRYVPGGGGWYYEWEEKSEWKPIGKRVSFGLTYIWGY
ncbi:hypothetical protein JW879_07060 [candidate division WOR-3 bacterium]|nr:hypothetical protein [candidate division WOR-3 bacterium]